MSVVIMKLLKDCPDCKGATTLTNSVGRVVKCEKCNGVGNTSGKLCIHWLMRDPMGAMEKIMQVPAEEPGKLTNGKVRCRIACDPSRRSDMPEHWRNEITLFLRSDDPRAVTCFDCIATPEYSEAMAQIKRTGA
jgi:hypothetical protein